MRVWVDCTAAAHPLVLRPVIERLEAAGHEVLVTTREYGQTVGILERLGIAYTAVGEHGGAGRVAKGRALAGRSGRLMRLIWGWRPSLALAHGSVDLAVVSGLLRLPSVQMQDYEYAGLQRQVAFRVARRVLAPASIPVKRLARVGAGERKLFRYPGLKEDYYLADLVPDPAVLDDLGLDRDRVVVVVRPPPETSEYHAPNALSDAVLDRLAHEPEVQTVVIPRTERQATAARALGGTALGSAPYKAGAGPGTAVAGEDSVRAAGAADAATDQGAATGGRLIVPDRAIDAQNLIAHADLVVSAGGTMNREAVALGVPVYTTFAGRM
ncbi:MAG TPA: DUF354 domain-containing protein, partial [Solirubrobacterales bacterium]|nr:DUF354 domain-containing protein [Solirubrobacterales bacterium]